MIDVGEYDDCELVIVVNTSSLLVSLFCFDDVDDAMIDVGEYDNCELVIVVLIVLNVSSLLVNISSVLHFDVVDCCTVSVVMLGMLYILVSMVVVVKTGVMVFWLEQSISFETCIISEH